MEETIKELEAEITRLREKVHFFDKVFWAVIAVAAIFGISGAWGVTLVINARDTIAKLDQSVAVAESRIDGLQKTIDESERKITMSVFNASAQIEERGRVVQRETERTISEVVTQLNSAKENLYADLDKYKAQATGEIKEELREHFENLVEQELKGMLSRVDVIQEDLNILNSYRDRLSKLEKEQSSYLKVGESIRLRGQNGYLYNTQSNVVVRSFKNNKLLESTPYHYLWDVER
ncbi:hypothetical protein [Roseibium sp. LAB1]